MTLNTWGSLLEVRVAVLWSHRVGNKHGCWNSAVQPWRCISGRVVQLYPSSGHRMVPKPVSSEGTSLALRFLILSLNGLWAIWGQRTHSRRHWSWGWRIGLGVFLVLGPVFLSFLIQPWTSIEFITAHGQQYICSLPATSPLGSLLILCPCSLKGTPFPTHPSFIFSVVFRNERWEISFFFCFAGF